MVRGEIVLYRFMRESSFKICKRICIPHTIEKVKTFKEVLEGKLFLNGDPYTQITLDNVSIECDCLMDFLAPI